ncbi:hypothetical protein CYY_001175 [Polysphondylium violaceum]|uniref:lysine--tRNA ligase n=1 Tax=Polysphondylium violaceum TaxID=133409 RepID=A0A8J4Q2H7_9MYCE|nr:hypothetical protein CYY_001175 [Polysphondylium violaceum]
MYRTFSTLVNRSLSRSLNTSRSSSSSFISRSFSSKVVNKNKNNNGEQEVSEEDMESETYLKQYFQSREDMVREYSEKTGKQIYEAQARQLSHTLKNFRKEFQGQLENGGKLMDRDNVVVAGRIKSIRISSDKLFFIDIRATNADPETQIDEPQSSLQVMANLKYYQNAPEFSVMQNVLRKGDVIEIRGIPAKSNLGELSIIPKEISLLTPCMRPIPFKLRDKENRYRNRALDFIVNPQIQRAFLIRSKMINFLRSYLVERGFLEVDTPILSTNVGGANAKPFKTHSNSLDLDLFLRISPELFLKQLVISGFDRVFEIGKQFRNEGIDLTHNPEFTTCEFYQAYSDYNELIAMTEDLLSKMVYHTLGTYEVPLPSNPDVMISFKAPFQKINFIDKIEELVGRKLPKDLVSYDCIPELLEICKENGINCKKPHTPTRILDEMASTLLEPLCTQPTFIIDHPLAMSPLAKLHRTSDQKTERFELFVGGKELVNAYSELNNPVEQRDRFYAQSKDRTTGDEEAQILDETYCNALEYGLPPTGGWGLGIDRLCMLFSNTTTIKDVILFPTMKPEVVIPPSSDKK